ncbi:hypothetical protein [Limnohabitans sp. Rim8]|uniref:hypothetical protein n=1 Tax=Limnohabitans sp. Rim8 TaxID=1100718 RepID=UPI003305AF1C
MVSSVQSIFRVLEEQGAVDFCEIATDAFRPVSLHNSQADFELGITINHDLTEPFSCGYDPIAVGNLAIKHVLFEAQGLKPNPITVFKRDGALIVKLFEQDTALTTARSKSCRGTGAIAKLYVSLRTRSRRHAE